MEPVTIFIAAGVVALLLSSSSAAGFVKPIDNITINQSFKGVGVHNGVDLRAAVGTPVKSPWPGTIENLYYADAGGSQLVVLHDNGYRTGFAHLSAYKVYKGQRVVAGQVIALTGATGTHITGPHLHFTVRNPTGQIIDPAKFLT